MNILELPAVRKVNMEETISYLTTDLDLVSAHTLDGMAAAFKLAGVPPRDVTKGGDGQIYATINAPTSNVEPEEDISVMLSVVESFDPANRTAWLACSVREFNIGYNCGKTPWGFNQSLSAELIARIAVAGASLRVTIYPEEPPTSQTRR